MKKILVLAIAIFSFFLVNAQEAKITIPDAWTDASSANLDKLTEWVVKGELTGVPGTKEYYISDSWNPSNSDLNAIRTDGGDTENWPLYWVVNDTMFFYQTVPTGLGNTVSLKSSVNTPNKTWGEWLSQSHVVYFRDATNPDQYWILAADSDGNFLGLNEMITIKVQYSSYIPSYVTPATLEANQDKVQRNSNGTFE